MRAKLTISVLLFLGSAGAAYVFISDGGPGDSRNSPSALENSNNVARETGGREDETAFLSALTKRRPEPIAIQHAEDFVTPDQNLALPPASAAVETVPAAVVPVPELSQALSLELPPRSGVSRSSAIAASVTARGPAASELVAQPERLPDVQNRGPGAPGTSRANAPVSRPQMLQVDVIAPPDRAPDPSISDRRVLASSDSLSPVTLSIGELLRRHGEPVEDDDLFYIHSVRGSDGQGLWGIIQQGVTRSLLTGVPVRETTGEDTLRVEIPSHADERLDDNSSSFLGRLIHEKVRHTYIYNFKRNRMGRNADVVRPGQEIVIVRFHPEELVSIYRHFRGRG